MKGGENGVLLVKGYKLSGIQGISSEGVVYRMVSIVNNTVLCT